MKKPPLWWLVCLCFCDCNCVYFKSSKLVGMKWHDFARIPEAGVRKWVSIESSFIPVV